MQQHSAACKKNWICQNLGLGDVVAQPKSPEKVEGSKRRISEGETMRKKTKLSYILES